ncbi:MAG: type IV pilus twitching motility protein PilT, partial [Burkholderiales bacterium]
LRLAQRAGIRGDAGRRPRSTICNDIMHINDLLKIAVSSGASDLHLKVGSYPMMRLNGSLVVVSEEKRLDRPDTESMANALFTPDHLEKFRKSQEVDLAYSVPGLGRFRVNVFQQRGTVGLVLRVIPHRIKTIDELGLPPVLKRIAAEERGLVLVTGTTGSGKSTTLAAMIDYVNATRSAHIMTVEDPIEYLHRDHHSLVNQREVAVDTKSFSHALRSALRQDPDVILVGEMRDFETVETALLAAETGHLVFSTLHTLDATETINRIITVFPPHQQRQVRIQLASVLKAAISQRLLPRADGAGRVAAVEVMVSTAFIRDAIVDKDKTSMIHGAIAAGTSQYGMQTFDQSIFSLYQHGLVTLEEALRWASNVDEFKLKVQGISTSVDMSREAANAPKPAPRAGGPPEITRFGG